METFDKLPKPTRGYKWVSVKTGLIQPGDVIYFARYMRNYRHASMCIGTKCSDFYKFGRRVYRQTKVTRKRARKSTHGS